MRWLECQKCREVVGVHEEPVEHLDERLYVCGQCLKPIEGQLEIVEGHRVETRPYDPSQSKMPEGF